MLSLLPGTQVVDRDSLSSTASTAAGGGRVVGLVPIGRDARRWHATVITAEGARDVRLDTLLRTVEVIPTPAVTQAA